MTLLTIVPPAQRLPGGAVRRRSAGPRDALLQRLARELDVPVERFFQEAPAAEIAPGEPSDGEAGELLALVRHWLAIGDGQARRRVLSLARQEAERAGDRACA